MNRPLLHPRTEQYINRYFSRPSHGLLLTGSKGMGKTFLAEWIGVQLQKEVLIIAPTANKQGIAIEQIRQLYQLTQTGNNLVVIIEHTDTMSDAAQNAFLKLLEEPPENVLFILTASSPHHVLSTIRSRTQHIEVIAPTRQQFEPYITSKDTSQSLLHTSEGKPGIFFSLLKEDEQLQAHETVVTNAKKFYVTTPFERHLYCSSIGFEKTAIQHLLDMLAIIIQTLLHTTEQSNPTHQKLAHQARLVEQTATRILAQNGNPKIHMTKLCQEL